MTAGRADGRPTVVFAETGRWTCFEAAACLLRRRGVRSVRVTSERGRFSGLVSRLCYDELVVAPSDDAVAATIAEVVRLTPSLLDVQCSEPLVASVADALRAVAVPEALRESLDGRAALVDKVGAWRWLADRGVPVPRRAAADLDWDAASALLGSPLVVKRAVGFGGSGVRVVGGAREYDAALAAFGRDDDTFLEEHVAGPIVQYGATFASGDVPREAVYETSRSRSGDVGPATAMALVDDEEMRRVGHLVAGGLPGRGVVNVEAVRSPAGPVVIDVNVRVWGQVLPLAVLGEDFVGSLLQALGAGVAPAPAPARDGRGRPVRSFPEASIVLAGPAPASAVARWVRDAVASLPVVGGRYVAAALVLLVGTLAEPLRTRIRRSRGSR